LALISLLEFPEEILTTFQVKVAAKGTFGLRQILIRESRAKGEILLVFIYSGKYCDKKEAIAREISRKYPEVVGVCQSENTGAASPVLGNKHVVYVSCNPAILVRDLRYLTDGGYAVAEVQPVDMFPQMAHVECVILMQRSGLKDEK
jgi:tRNA/tmRNA/rRNA uracil-C5-methylase (TrmA/RlmC/RlmD family)